MSKTKMMKKILGIIFLGLLLSGCASEVPPDKILLPGQHTTPQPAGTNKWLTEGFATNDVMKGAETFCLKSNKSLEVLDLKPNSETSKATLIFSCN
jgi:PBP1b-binding outer membrane lipoprotein LpoB|tara:strand:+ start:671 stop:958 length:288 start_codon:yes stop_codon:yes gene_type:complete